MSGRLATWRGKPLEELTRAELEDALRDMLAQTLAAARRMPPDALIMVLEFMASQLEVTREAARLYDEWTVHSMRPQ